MAFFLAITAGLIDGWTFFESMHFGVAATVTTFSGLVVGFRSRSILLVTRTWIRFRLRFPVILFAFFVVARGFLRINA